MEPYREKAYGPLGAGYCWNFLAQLRVITVVACKFGIYPSARQAFATCERLYRHMLRGGAVARGMPGKGAMDMNDAKQAQEQLQDEHLDMLLRLAYRYEDELIAREILAEFEATNAADIDGDPQAAYALFRARYERQQAQQKRQQRNRRLKRALRRTVEVAACFVVLMAIAAPFAIANVDAIRVKVMELLIEVKDDHTELSFVEDESAAFEVPAGWNGLYYPSYTPEKYQFIELDDRCLQARYQDADGNNMYFSEYNPTAKVDIDSENAEISYEDINGARGMVVQKEQRDYIMVTWAYEDKFFLLECQGTTLDEALKIARSVRRIK